jgi:uncharacterized protein with HEPN domain
MSRPFDTDLLFHIAEACRKIVLRTANVTREQFAADEIIVDSVIRQLEIMGEAVRLISEKIKKEYAEVPWSRIQAMRTRLIHGYWGVDVNAVWDVATRHIPELCRQINEIVEAEEKGS